MTYDVQVEVQLREGISDPQGATVERALPALGFSGIDGVRMGKSIRFTVQGETEEVVRQQVDELCARFLTNPVIEHAIVNIVAAGTAGDTVAVGTTVNTVAVENS